MTPTCLPLTSGAVVEGEAAAAPDLARAQRALRLLQQRANGPASAALDQATVRAAARILRESTPWTS